MNKEFKSEFKKLNATEIKEIVYRCSNQEILEFTPTANNNLENSAYKYFIKYIENEEYGYWNVEWGWKQIKLNNMPFASGYFQHSIKISPFRIDFENMGASNAYSKSNNKKQLEDYLYIYINKNCPHYKQAIIEEAENFIKKLEICNAKKIKEDELVK